MRVLVIGYGSIGQRHARILSELECPVAVVSKRKIDWKPHYASISDALGDFDPGYVVIANKTSEHGETLRKLKRGGFKGVVLVEKPLFSKVENVNVKGFKKVIVGYNLRFHPVLQKLKELLRKERIISFQAYAGGYLPDWRPQADYRKGYSASRRKGGGVLRDLSHELDYTAWICGKCLSLTALGGHFSGLRITSDDVFAILMKTERCPVVSIQINYLDRVPRREILVNTNRHTFKADLIGNSLEVDGKIRAYKTERDDAFRAEHKAVFIGRDSVLCSAATGSKVMKTIDAAEIAVRKRKWVSA